MNWPRNPRLHRNRHRRTEPRDGGRPLAEGSRFRFDSHGCIYNWSTVFGAYINGDLNEAEMRAVDDHQASCLKCHNSLCAHLGAFEDQMLSDAPQAQDRDNSESSADEKDSESSGQDESEDDFRGSAPHDRRGCRNNGRRIKKLLLRAQTVHLLPLEGEGLGAGPRMAKELKE
jgi:hypothetical protein